MNEIRFGNPVEVNRQRTRHGIYSELEKAVFDCPLGMAIPVEIPDEKTLNRVTTHFYNARELRGRLLELGRKISMHVIREGGTTSLLISVILR